MQEDRHKLKMEIKRMNNLLNSRNLDLRILRVKILVKILIKEINNKKR